MTTSTRALNDHAVQPTSAVHAVGLALAALVLFGSTARAQEDVALTGTLRVLRGEDFENRKSDVLYFVDELQDGALPARPPRSFRVGFDRGLVPAGVTSGAVLRLRGKRHADGTLSVSAVEGGEATVVAPGSFSAVADQRTLVMLVNFRDRPLSSSATRSTVSGIMFDDSNSIDALYREVSTGRVSFSGTVVGPYTVDFDASSTDFQAWGRDAMAQASAAGIDLSQYPRRVFVTPSNGTGYGGLGQVGGSVTEAYIFSWSNRLFYTHELGHNLGMRHASTPGSEYGDGSCFMGAGSNLRHCNAPHKLDMGWIDAGEVTSASNGTYTITALAEPSAQARVLRVPVDGSDDLYVSFRNGAGFDGSLGAAYVPRTSVHTWSGGGYTKTYLQKTLGDGESYSNTTHGITITQLSNDGVRATLRVAVVTKPETPQLTLSPAAGAAQAGATATYSVLLTNRDSAASPSSTFAFSAAGPTGWSVVVSPASLTLGPGQSSSAKVSVTSLSSDADTAQAVRVFVRDSLEPVHSVDATVTHHVDGTAPSDPTALFASTSRRSVSLAWSASSDANAQLGLTYLVWRDGALLGTSTSTRYADTPGSGTFVYEVSVRDQAGNLSGRSNLVTVSMSKGGGKSGGGQGGGKGKKK